ncbi:MAG: DNA cytosine methyltransferase [Gammaproteobacteria bacterium]
MLTDNDPFCCDVLRARVADGSLKGDVLQKDVRELTGDDLRPFRQVHLFAGIGGFALAQKWSGWPEDWSLVTGGPPCQPTSIAGAQRGEADPRYLWPEMARLIEERQPDFALYENPTGTPELAIDRVLVDLESLGYEVGAYVIPACAVGAMHQRNRFWIVAHSGGIGCTNGANLNGSYSQPSISNVGQLVASKVQGNRELQSDAHQIPCFGTGIPYGREERATFIRRALCREVHGLPDELDRIAALGNAIVPQVATVVMKAMIRATR